MKQLHYADWPLERDDVDTMAPTGPRVETIGRARRQLSGHVARFRREGVDADPVVFGAQGQPESALLPYETLVLLLDLAEDVAIAARMRERVKTDSGRRTSLAAVAAELGVDLDDL